MTVAVSFVGDVTTAGKLVLRDPGAFRVACGAYVGRAVTLTLEEAHATRSVQANKRYWSRIVETLRKLWSAERGVDYSKEQTHYALKASFLGTVELNGVLVPRDSHSLSTAEFADLCDAIEGHFASQGVEFPEV